MNNFIDFLEENNIEYEIVSYGNPNYYNDGFQVPAIRISFNYELSDNLIGLKKKEDTFLKEIKHNRSFCIGYSYIKDATIHWYSVFNVDDYKRWQDHQAKMQADLVKILIRRKYERLNKNIDIKWMDCVS